MIKIIVLTPEEMREVDKMAIESGFPELILMETAGRGVAEKARLVLAGHEHGHDHGRKSEDDQEIEHDHLASSKDKVLVIAGKGNNGGDGFVAARYLDIWGFSVRILMLAAEKDLKGSPLVNYNLCKLREIEIANFEGYLEEIENLIYKADLIIDAMLGTGIKGSVREPYARVIELVNHFANPVLAVDIPSGMCSQTGRVLGNAVIADYTITMAYPKLGLLVFPGRQFCGDVEIVDLGVPDEFAFAQNPTHFVLDNFAALSLLPQRAEDSHKGNFGKVGIVGGSLGMSGAPSLSGLAALKVGAGLVRVAVPEEIQAVVAGYSPEIMTVGLKNLRNLNSGDQLDQFAEEQLDELMDQSTVMAVGPGLGTSTASKQIVKKLLEEYQGPLILDADGINSLKDLKLLSQREEPVILTPHPGEMARLIGKDIGEIEANRIDIARNFAQEHEIYLILKGATTVVALPEGVVYINPSGNEGMATAGSGDVLTGIIAGLLAMGMGVEEAVILAPYLHGLAGDLAADELSSYSMTASDIISYIGVAINYLRQDD